jgi:glycerol-3-phosphate O-acyltransferase
MGIPGNVALQQARVYAREIVPGFSTTLYFGFATRAARWLSRGLYRVRIGKLDTALSHIDPKSTVVFVINHRSNMDYILITWLVSSRANLSYAVGEWARIWPLSALIRAMGAYFIRRGDRNTLYRRVLARYVQMATAAGSTQAIFPEGGLSLTGEIGPAKMGLLSYIADADMQEGRDVVFVPVGLAYDRIIEDRILTAAAAAGTRRFAAPPLRVLRFGAGVLWQMLRGRFAGFGTAAAGFGAPISLRDFDGNTEQLGAHLMAQIGAVVPVVPVNLIAAVVQRGAQTEVAILRDAQAMIAAMTAQGAVFSLPAIDKLLHHGLHPLIARGILRADLTVSDSVLLDFYAAPLQTRSSHTPEIKLQKI